MHELAKAKTEQRHFLISLDQYETSARDSIGTSLSRRASSDATGCTYRVTCMHELTKAKTEQRHFLISLGQFDTLARDSVATSLSRRTRSNVVGCTCFVTVVIEIQHMDIS
jgi:hypothetical protein